jgi:signal transduction histidine kinase
MLIIMAIALVITGGYLLALRRQLSRMAERLENRENSRVPSNLDINLMDRTLNRLAAAINGCLEHERQVRIEALRAEQLQKDTIAGISHDFRTPLTSVIGYLQLCKPGVENQAYIGTALRRACDLNQLVEQFYELSLLDNGEHECRLERVNLANLLSGYILENADLLEERQLIPVLSGFETPVYAHVDSGFMQRIMQNLVANCAKHANGDVRFTLEALEQPILRISNRVKAADIMDAARLFERFYTGDGARQGSGIGLAVVKALVEQMGGQVAALLDRDELEIRITFPPA